MANQFPRKSLPTASADPLSLIRHISEADPHPGRYIKLDGNTLDLEHPTLFKSYAEFQKMPSQDTVLGWSPRLVIFTGADARDPITGVVYQQMHPYVFEGATVVVGSQKYPVWVDKIGCLTDTAFVELKSLLYQHETDTGSLTTEVHPTLARKNHIHHYTAIDQFSEGVYEVSKGIYAYAVGNETELNNRRIDNALIIYTGEEYEYTQGRYVERGHLYRYDAANSVWIDVTASNEGYSKREIDEKITLHNNNASPWSHSGLATSDHTHIAADTTDFDARVTVVVGDQIGDAISAHEASNSAHAARFDAKADSSVVSSHIADTTVHITSSERTSWNDKLDSSHDQDLDAHASGFAHTLTISNSWPVYVCKNTDVIHTYRPASTADVGDFSILFSDKDDAPPAIFGCDVDQSGVYTYMHVLNSIAQSSGLAYKADLRIRVNDDGSAYVGTGAVLSGVSAVTVASTVNDGTIATTKYVHDYVVAQGSGVQSVNTITPVSGNVTLVGSNIPYASSGDVSNVYGVLSSHIANGTSHITTAERTAWSSAYDMASAASAVGSAHAANTSVHMTSTERTALEKVTAHYVTAVTYATDSHTYVHREWSDSINEYWGVINVNVTHTLPISASSYALVVVGTILNDGTITPTGPLVVSSSGKTFKFELPNTTTSADAVRVFWHAYLTFQQTI